MNRQRSRWLAIALVAIGVAAVPVVGNADAPQSAGGGGEIIDGGTFSIGTPDHIDPALNTELDSFQVINAVYDGLTDIDDSDPENIVVVPHLAESYESNEDATLWTFTVKEGQQFSDGEPILPSTFQRSWERAADLPGNYIYLLDFIEGGASAVVDGEADTISGSRRRRRGDDAHGHAVGSVRQLPRARRRSRRSCRLPRPPSRPARTARTR